MNKTYVWYVEFDGAWYVDMGGGTIEDVSECQDLVALRKACRRQAKLIENNQAGLEALNRRIGELEIEAKPIICMRCGAPLSTGAEHSLADCNKNISRTF